MHIFRKEDDPSLLNNSEFLTGFPVEFIETQLQDQGWCPSDIELLKMGALGSRGYLPRDYTGYKGGGSQTALRSILTVVKDSRSVRFYA